MIFTFGLLFFLAVCILYTILYFRYKAQCFAIESAPSARMILVPGAGLDPDNTPSDILKDRLLSALRFQKFHHAEKIILSGASDQKRYDETAAMEKFLLSKQVSPTSIDRDPSGFSTFHSLVNYSLKYPHISFIFISQRFHLTRALLLADLLGLRCAGIIADNIPFSISNRMYWYIREVIATPFNLLKFVFYKLGYASRKR